MFVSNLFNFVSRIWQSSKHHLTFRLVIPICAIVLFCFVCFVFFINVTNDFFSWGGNFRYDSNKSSMLIFSNMVVLSQYKSLELWRSIKSHRTDWCENNQSSCFDLGEPFHSNLRPIIAIDDNPASRIFFRAKLYNLFIIYFYVPFF